LVRVGTSVSANDASEVEVLIEMIDRRNGIAVT
jgi:hypothetical protein